MTNETDCRIRESRGEYEHTRHNMGFDVIDELARRWNVTQWKTDLKAKIGMVIFHGEKNFIGKTIDLYE